MSRGVKATERIDPPVWVDRHAVGSGLHIFTSAQLAQASNILPNGSSVVSTVSTPHGVPRNSPRFAL